MDNKDVGVSNVTPHKDVGVSNVTPQYQGTTDSLSFGKKSPVFRRSFFALLVYCGAVSAALIVLAVLGSIHVNKIEKNCPNTPTPNSTGQWKDHTDAYRLETNDTKGQCFLNTAANKQMMNDGNGSVTVIDFNRGVTGYYVNSIKRCYLSGGLEPHLASTAQLEQHFKSGPVKKSAADQDTELLGEVDYSSGQEVKDTSMLPTELLGTCAGKPTNWLNKNITQLSELEEDESADSAGIKCEWRTVMVTKRFRQCSGWWRRRKCQYVTHVSSSRVFVCN